jgi:circadian clock protein KaiC
MPPPKLGSRTLAKSPTGIKGLDEITGGGLPLGRPTLICGGAGCGKTLMAMEFIVHGAMDYGEPGVFVSFEENAEELATNVRSLGYDLDRLVRQKKLVLDYVRLEPAEIEETGEYNLDGLFVRLNYAIDSIGAKRVVLDTIEALFGGLANETILRAELRRLFRWLKSKGVTAIVTGERGEKTLTRHGLEEYVADCVILLDHRVSEEISTRRLRIVKYRGSAHGMNEYPFIIDQDGISVLPITSLRLDHPASRERVSTGIPALDAMLGGKGYFLGSSILISGSAGTGKTSVAAHFVDGACRRGERALYFAFEESPDQIFRNMNSIGLDLRQWVKKGLLRFHAARPSLYGLETHLALITRETRNFGPTVVVCDPITGLGRSVTLDEMHAMLARLIDFFKAQRITSIYTSLTAGPGMDPNSAGVSSAIDTWIQLRDFESNGERNRGIDVIKSRGMAHSRQIRELVMNSHGVELLDTYVGPNQVLMGTARVTQESQELAADVVLEQDITRRERELEEGRRAMEAEIKRLRSEYRLQAERAQTEIAQASERLLAAENGRESMARLRADSGEPQRNARAQKKPRRRNVDGSG